MSAPSSGIRPRQETTRQGSLNGLLTTVITLGISFLLSLVTDQFFIANAVAGKVMEATPTSLAVPLLARMGPAAKPFALAGALALMALLGSAAGAAGEALMDIKTRSPHPASAAITDTRLARLRSAAIAIILAAAQALVVIALSGERESLMTLASYALWAPVFLALSGQKERSGEADRGRRWFLRRGVQAVAGLFLVSSAATWTLLFKTISGDQPGKALFPFSPPPSRNPDFEHLPGLVPEVTPVERFYLMSKSVEDPSVSSEGWRLRVQGLVAHPLDLSYQDILGLPRVNQWMTLRCVSNPVGGPLISNAYWSGVPLREVLAMATVQSGATSVAMKARDTYSDSFPLQKGLLETTLVAYAVNGQLLNRDHGFPARVLVPGLYGFKNVKWVEEIEIISGEFSGPWQRLGWTRTAIQTTFSRIDFVRQIGDQAVAAGIAFAGDRGIRAVQVQVNQGAWVDAELNSPPLGPLAWVQWRHDFRASGNATVTVRAVDGTGALQEEAQRSIFPDGATGWHSVTVPL